MVADNQDVSAPRSIAGTGVDHLAVDNIDIPSELVVLSVVGRIAQSHAEIERRYFVQGVDCLDSGIEYLGRIEDNPRIAGLPRLHLGGSWEG